MLSREDAETFEQARPRLFGLAYRILGTVSDAEDAVQDTFVKWAKADRAAVERPGAWLTTVCTRRSLDLLDAAHRARTSYVGAWLPEPLHTATAAEQESRLELAGSLTTAFLLMLERLTPKERAAYLLHEVFDAPYADVAETLDMQESACRKLVSRAKANIGQDKIRHAMPVNLQEQFLAAFQTAVTQGATTPLTSLLAKDVRLSTDGGGKVPAALNIIHGVDNVLAFVGQGLHKYWQGHAWDFVEVNGTRGIVLRENGMPVATASFAFNQDGLVTDIFIVRNPDKLASQQPISVH